MVSIFLNSYRFIENAFRIIVELTTEHNEKHMGKHLQKHLFLHGMRSLTIPGWEILEENEIIAFKSPSEAPFIDFVYGKVTLENYEKAKKFYAAKPFVWLVDTTCVGKELPDWGFSGPDIESEMILSLHAYDPPKQPSHFETCVADTLQDYNKWLCIAAEWLGLGLHEVEKFFTPWIEQSKSTPCLTFLNGEAAATSLLYCNEDNAAIYCLGVRRAFRGWGLAVAAAEGCLEFAKKRNISKVVLYASPMGKPFYEKMGFKMVQELYGYSYG